MKAYAGMHIISHNLKPLTRCDFAFVERKRKERTHTLNRETMEPMYEIVENHVKKCGPKKEVAWKVYEER